MPTIEIEVKNKIAKSPAEHIICGNSDYKIKFAFDEEWAEHNVKTARFVYNRAFEDVVFHGDVCNVPVISNTTVCLIGVFAGDLRTTTPALVNCDKSILCAGGIPADPEPDVYAQIVAMIDAGMLKGDTGKSAYQYAQDGGYEGTEEDFAELMASYSNPAGGAVTDEQIAAAVEEYMAENPVEVDMPDALPNPNKLTLTGAVQAEYDGSKPVEVEIPEGGGGIEVTGAEVGQTIVVKAVDENGKPTEWECAELNNSKWRLIHEFTIPEDLTSDMSGVQWLTNANGHISRFYVATDINGEAFSVKKLEIRFANFYPQDKATSCSVAMAFNPRSSHVAYLRDDNISLGAGGHKDGGYGRVSVECLDETEVVRVSGSSANATPYGSSANLVNANPDRNFGGRNGLTAKSIKGVLVWISNETIGFYPGGKIKIWGCDA